MFEYINKYGYMHAFSAVLIYPSAIYDCFLFHVEHNFNLLTLKMSTIFMGPCLDRDFWDNISQDVFDLCSVSI